ncbi:Uncharacterised protein [Mycobacterium tuberculosis]|nr:Uncharacterised protein [Mycobacterium tuberculosis]
MARSMVANISSVERRLKIELIVSTAFSSFIPD